MASGAGNKERHTSGREEKKKTVQIVFLKSKRNESFSNSRHLKAGWNNF